MRCARGAHLDTAPEKRWETQRGCVRSTSRSDWRERHIEVVSPRPGIRGCCGWSFGHSRAGGGAEDAPGHLGHLRDGQNVLTKRVGLLDCRRLVGVVAQL